MKNTDFDKWDEIINRSVICMDTLSAGFSVRTGSKMLARHRNRENRRLYAGGVVYFCLALAGAFGLSWLISEPFAATLLQTLFTHKAVFIFGMAVFTCGYFFDKDLLSIGLK
jgi:hypothetical protein